MGTWQLQKSRETRGRPERETRERPEHTMETEEWEKQKLMDVQLEPTSRLGSSEEVPWDSDSDWDQTEPSWSQRGVCPDLDQDQDQDQDRARARRKLLLAGAVGILFTIAEAVGGYLSQSLAVLSDSAHLLSDVCSVGLSLFSLWISSRSPTDTMTFGWHRAEVLAVLGSLLSLWGVTLVLLWSAGLRLRHDFSLNSRIMLLTSSCAVCVNLLMVCILHQGSAHTHSHGSMWGQRGPHSHGPGQSLGPDRSNSSVRAAFVHVLGDLLQSLGVLLAAAVIHVWPQYKVADPLCTFLFSALVLWTTIPVFRDVLRVLMEATPPHIDLTRLRELLLSLHGVTSVHSLRVWSLSPGCPLLSVHVTAEGGADSQLVLRSCTDLLLSEFHFRHITVQVEKNQDQDRDRD